MFIPLFLFLLVYNNIIQVRKEIIWQARPNANFRLRKDLMMIT